MKKLKVLLIVFSIGFISLFGMPKLQAAAQSPFVYEVVILYGRHISGQDETYQYGADVDFGTGGGGIQFVNFKQLMYMHLNDALPYLYINTGYFIFPEHSESYYFWYCDGLFPELKLMDINFNVIDTISYYDFGDLLLGETQYNDFQKGYNAGQNTGYNDGKRLGYEQGSLEYGFYDSNEDELLKAVDYGMRQFLKGKDEGYDEGYDEARDFYADEGTFGGLLSYVLKPFEVLTYEVFPNITIGTIVLIPIIFGLIGFLFRLRGRK